MQVNQRLELLVGAKCVRKVHLQAPAARRPVLELDRIQGIVSSGSHLVEQHDAAL